MTCPVPIIKKSTRVPLFKKAVALCVDKGYLPYASFVANQILEKEKNRDFDIVICVPTKTDIPVTANSEIRYCTIDYSSIPKLPVGRLSMATYYKLFLPAIFQEEYEQILYLDADVYIVNGKISETLAANLNNQAIAMAIDISEIERKSGFDFHNNYLDHYKDKNHLYRNAGVILFNTKKLLEINYLDILFTYAKKNYNKLTKHDQTLINTVLHNYIGSISFLNNYQLIDSTILLQQDFNPNILHFVGELKPWNTDQGYIGSYYNEYKCFIEKNFPNHSSQLKSEFQIKYECRKRKCKYTNPIRENLSLKVFVAKEKLKSIVSVLRIQKEKDINTSTKIKRVISRFRSTIHRSILECEVNTLKG